MKMGLTLQMMLLAVNLALFFLLAREHADMVALQTQFAGIGKEHGYREANRPVNSRGGERDCADYGDNPPGVTVYLETTPAEIQAATSPQGKRQWTAVSFKEAGRAPDGSNQAVMSIHKVEENHGQNESIPVRSNPRWQ